MKKIVNSFYCNYFLLILIVFLVIYTFSLTFTYIEGDDASIILYHMMGRNSSLQERYSDYQAMFDVLLSFLPANESLLRIFSIAISALSAYIFAILAVNIAFQWAADNKIRKIDFIFLFLLLSPELFFSGLYINPTMLSLAVVLLAHLLLKTAIKNKHASKTWIFLSSILLFGIGVSIRWSLITYGLVIFLDLVMDDTFGINPESKSLDRRKIKFSIIWAALSLISTLFFILLSQGDEINFSVFTNKIYFLNEFLLGGDVPGFSVISIAKLMTLFSPFLMLGSAVGIYSLFKRRSWKLIILFFYQLVLISVFLRSGIYKDSFTILPIVWALFIEGMKKMVSFFRSSLPIYAVIIFALLPWFVGLKIFSSSTLWGPGFEIRKPGDSMELTSKYSLKYSSSINYSIGSINPEFDAGFALSTPEGPRPLGGYFYVLFGKWKEFFLRQSQQIWEITQQGIRRHFILHVSGGGAERYLIELINSGYSQLETGHVAYHPEAGNLHFRLFNNMKGDSVKILYLDGYSVIKKSDFCDIDPILCKQTIPLITDYSSVINELYHELDPKNLVIFSPFSGSLTINRD